MQQTRCPNCGALFSTSHEGAVCPFCGVEATSKLQRLFSFLRANWPLFVLVALFFLIVRPSGEVWSIIGFFALIAAAGAVCFGIGRATKGKSAEEPLTLDLETTEGSEHGANPRVVPMRPPKVPERWRDLVATRPPRDLYLPGKEWGTFVAEGITVILTVSTYTLKSHKHRQSVTRFMGEFLDPANVGVFLVYSATWVVRLKKIFSTRHIVRDGEVTIGYTTNRSWNRANYQFWTQTGEMFEAKTAVVKRPDVKTDFGLIPVFYLPDNPRKSVALYGTEFRIRGVGDKAAAPLPKVEARASLNS